MLFDSRLSPVISFAFLLVCSYAVRIQELTAEERGHYLISHDRYLFAFNPPQPEAQYIENLSHLSVSHPTLEKDALDYAKKSGNGPFYARPGVGDGSGVLFVATKISGNSLLGRSWNLRHNVDGEIKVYDAQLYWRVDRRGTRLLRFGIWPEGSTPPQVMTMQEAVNRFTRRMRWFGCC